MAGEGLSVQLATRVLPVSESGYYAWRSRPPSPRSLRHSWLSEAITTIHTASHGTYGIRRVHAELRLGHGIPVSHDTVMLLMQRADIKGLPGNRRRRPRHETPTAADLVDRNFARTAPDKLWVTDITEHPTREGKVYCAVVLDTHSRRVVGWSIDSSQTAALVTNALNMATVIHSDRGSQGGFNWSSQHLISEVCDVATADWSLKTSDVPKGARRQWRADRALRPAMRSPGRPDPSRVVQRQFWRLIATGVTTVEASLAVGVSWPVGARWFRHAVEPDPGTSLR
jgi:transposase InsO family protein